jgi:hypothetical protein
MTILRRNNPWQHWHWSSSSSSSYAVLVVVLLSVVVILVVGAEPNKEEKEDYLMLFRPELHLTARIKQHRQGATGDLVQGEEELRKIILNWDPIVNAKAYEICHLCSSIDSNSGQREDDSGEDSDGGTVISIPVGRHGECGGMPCLVVPGVPLGWNTFHLRVQLPSKHTTDDDRWSLWSPVRNFHVHPEVLGSVDHSDEL